MVAPATRRGEQRAAPACEFFMPSHSRPGLSPRSWECTGRIGLLTPFDNFQLR